MFRKKFFELTEGFENHKIEQLGVFNVWNFLFYLSTGLTIVLAVRAGGVIPVFAYLVVPPVSAILLTRKNTGLVLIAMLISILGSLFGVYFSVHFDFPAGSSIVAVLGMIYLRLTDLPRGPVGHRHRLAGVINKELLAGAVLLAYHQIELACPEAIALTGPVVTQSVGVGCLVLLP